MTREWTYYRFGDRSRLVGELEALKMMNVILDFRLAVFEIDGEDVGYVKAYVLLFPFNDARMLHRIEQERIIEQMARMDLTSDAE